MAETVTALTAVTAAGGVAKSGSETHVKILRSKAEVEDDEVLKVDLKAVMSTVKGRRRQGRRHPHRPGRVVLMSDHAMGGAPDMRDLVRVVFKRLWVVPFVVTVICFAGVC